MTSNGALQQVKSMLFARKAGHTGSLDPIATGLLPICFGHSTKISSFFLEADKDYRVRFRLGLTTTTGDSEGEIVNRRDIDFSVDQLKNTLKQFSGEIDQVPPMYSAIKHQGQPLYKLARQGIEIERAPRKVTVYSLNLIDRGEQWIELVMRVSSGFYVRSLAVDIGEKLGCGAYVEQLRRTKVGHLDIQDAFTLEQIESHGTPREREALLIATDQALSHLPRINLSDNVVYYLRQGKAVRATNTPSSGLVRLYSPSIGFLGVGEVKAEQKIAPKQLLSSS